MARIDDLVRVTLRDLARQARGAELAQAAMARARRMRRRRLAKIVAGLTAVTVGAVVPPVVLGAAAEQASPGPTTLYYSDGTTVLARFDGSGPVLTESTGLVVNQVLSELGTDPASPLRGQPWSQLREARVRVVTTIDARVQQILERVADPAMAGSPLAGLPDNVQAAAVVVEPGTGRVLAYYGGANTSGTDYAGVYADENGNLAGFGAHQPGGSFEVYTLAAALQAGYSLQSQWWVEPHDMPGRTGPNRIINSALCPGGGRTCSLADSTTVGLETTFYAVTASLGPASVLEMARDAGIDAMWDGQRRRVDLRDRDPKALTPGPFNVELGLGQYPVTVVDQANAMATYAASGLRAHAHFVREVWRGDSPLYGEKLPAPDQPRIMTAEASADLDWALSRTRSGQLEGRDSAGKTGNSYRADVYENEHAWMVGYTKQLAMAVWLGDRAGDGRVLGADGGPILGAGPPAQIYREVMTAAHAALGLPATPFPPPALAGDPDPPGSGIP